jgi:hypothetical protein
VVHHLPFALAAAGLPLVGIAADGRWVPLLGWLALSVVLCLWAHRIVRRTRR